MANISFGGYSSFKRPTSNGRTHDHRITLQQTDPADAGGGVYVINLGRVPNGDTQAFTCMFSSANYAAILALVDAGTLSTFIDEDGTITSNCRMIIKSDTRDTRFPDFRIVTFEIWRV